MNMREAKKKWDKLTDGWFGVIVYLFLGFVIAYTVNTGMSLALDTKTPVVAVFSNSMVPTFYRGDMILVVGDKDYKVGDIVVFDSPDKKYPIIHRINEIKDGGIVSKGDNNPISDEGRWGVIPFDKIYGKAVLKIPVLGWVKILFVDLTGLG
jgi:signal peptidase I